jgi:hypothetical protein
MPGISPFLACYYRPVTSFPGCISETFCAEVSYSARAMGRAMECARMNGRIAV